MASDVPPTVLLDVDGTLVDSNYQHAIAWHRAFHEHGYRAAIWEIHRHVGMGGDQFVGALLGEEAEDADGDELRDAHSEAYSKLIGEVEAIEGASELIHIGQAVLSFGGKIDYFIETVFNYPTLAECYKVAAFDGVNRLGIFEEEVSSV